MAKTKAMNISELKGESIAPEGQVAKNIGEVIHLKGPKLSKETEQVVNDSKAESIPFADVNDKELIEAFIKNPEMKKQAGILAFEIQKEFSNWFSISQIVKKFKTDIPEAAKKIEMLMLFNYCIGKVEKNRPLFKIDIDHRAQRIIIMNEIAEHEGKILFLKEKLGKLD